MPHRLLQFKNGQPAGVIEFGDSQLGLLRVVDPILTTLAQGYKNNANVAPFIFPTVPVEKETGRFPAFGQEAWKIYDTRRPLRGAVKKMEVVSGSVLISLDEHSLGFLLDDREKQEFALGEGPLRAIRQNMISDALDLERESNSAIACTTNGNFNAACKAAAPSVWSTVGDPVADWLQYREAVRGLIGRYPNVAVFDPKAWRLFRNNAAVRDRMKYTLGVGAGVKGLPNILVTEPLAAALLEVEEVYVGKAVFGTGPGGGVGEAALTVGDVWSQVQAGNLFGCYRGAVELLEPAFGYNFTKKNYPQVSAYRLEGNESDAYDEKRIYSDVVTLTNAALLLYNLA